MFEYRLSNFSPGLFVFQLFAVPPLCFIGGLLGYAMFAGRGSESFLRELIAYGIYTSMGLGLAFQIWKRAPQAAESGGKWIWIPPVALVAWGVTDQLGRYGPGGLADLLAPSLSARGGESGLGFVLITMPAVACASYSIAIATLHGRQARSDLR